MKAQSNTQYTNNSSSVVSSSNSNNYTNYLQSQKQQSSLLAQNNNNNSINGGNSVSLSASQQQFYQQQQQQQIPLQQQNQNLPYSRSHSRHSNHHNEMKNNNNNNNNTSSSLSNNSNVNSSNSTNIAKHTKTGSSYTAQQLGGGYPSGQQSQQQIRENQSSSLNVSKQVTNSQISQTSGLRPSQIPNLPINNNVSSSQNGLPLKATQSNEGSQVISKSNIENKSNVNQPQSAATISSTTVTTTQQQPQSSTIQLKTTATAPRTSSSLGRVAQQPVQKKRKTFECGGMLFTVDDTYEFSKQIGHGAYGVVCSGVDTKIGKKVAIKKISKAFADLVDAKRILREIKILKFFDHENVIALHDVIVPESRTGYEDIYIVTELMETDLHRVIYSRQDLTDDHVQYFLYQSLRAMLYIHSANVMHRDLKPSNILVNKNCDLKICDLGLARGFEDDEEDGKTEYVVTRWYRAPEVILKAQKYTKSIDVWSMGCIFAELLGRTPLFPGKDYLEQIQRIIAILGTPTAEELSYISNESALKFVKGLPKRTKQNWENLYPDSNPVGLDLLSKMLTFNPDDRYTMEECLAHPYFEGLHNSEDEPVAPELFDWSWDDFHLTKEKLQSMVYDEAVSYQQIKAQNDINHQQSTSAQS